jgi:hypothetical protein
MICLAPLLEPAKVARLLGVEVETLGAWRRKGYGPRWYRIGKKIRYAELDLRVWMNAQVGSRAAADPGREQLRASLRERSHGHPQQSEGGRER